MKKIDEGFDPILNINYELFSTKLSDLKVLVKSWYKGIDFKKFDSRYVKEKDAKNLVEMKKAGLICNLFFAYKEDEKYYLLDGFNRLLTEYGEIDEDTTVYLKLVTNKLEEHKLMEIMFCLNMWKLYSSGFTHGGFKITDFLDRGFRLLLFTKFGIEFYKYDYKDPNWYENRARLSEDLDIIDNYFILEYDYSADFKTTYQGVRILFSNENIVNDLKEIIKGNNYNKAPFKNYKFFLEGYARHLAYLRYTKDNEVYSFEYFLEELYKNKAFFKKLIGMSGNDSTRKNIYKFFREELK
jgi:hypothetical protein